MEATTTSGCFAKKDIVFQGKQVMASIQGSLEEGQSELRN